MRAASDSRVLQKHLLKPETVKIIDTFCEGARATTRPDFYTGFLRAPRSCFANGINLITGYLTKLTIEELRSLYQKSFRCESDPEKMAVFGQKTDKWGSLPDLSSSGQETNDETGEIYSKAGILYALFFSGTTDNLKKDGNHAWRNPLRTVTEQWIEYAFSEEKRSKIVEECSNFTIKKVDELEDWGQNLLTSVGAALFFNMTEDGQPSSLFSQFQFLLSVVPNFLPPYPTRFLVVRT